MFNWFSRDVSVIVSRFESLARQLETAVSFHTLQVEVHDEAIRFANEAKAFAEKEASRARAVAAKLRDLIA